MKVIFLNRFFYPDHSATSQMLSDLAFDLAENGWDVHVVTSWQQYGNPDARLPAHETVRGVRIHRVRTSRFGRASLWGRALDYLGFYAGAGMRLLRLAKPGDVVIVKTDPPMLSVIAAPVTKLRSANQINWLQDLFPEVATALEVHGAERLMSRLLRRLRDASLRAARVNVVLGELMAERVRGLGIGSEKVKVIHNWADGKDIHPVPRDENTLRRDWGLDGKFVVGYSGNMGRAHEFGTILDAAEILAGGGGSEQLAGRRSEQVEEASSEQKAESRKQEEKKGGSEQRAANREQEEKEVSREQRAESREQGEKEVNSEQKAASSEQEEKKGSHEQRAGDRGREVVFLFIGDGARRGWIEEEAMRRGIGNILFKPYQPRNLLAQSLSVPDVHLISLVPKLEGLIVPSKFYGIAAAGRATLFVGDTDGEIPRVLREEECGYAVPLGGGEVLAERINELVDNQDRCRQMGVRAREVFERKYDKKYALEKWEDVISKTKRAVNRKQG